MCLFVIKIPIDVRGKMVVDIITPMLGLRIDIVEVVIVELDPIKISVIINKTFFFYQTFQFFPILITIKLKTQEIVETFHEHVFPFFLLIP